MHIIHIKILKKQYSSTKIVLWICMIDMDRMCPDAVIEYEYRRLQVRLDYDNY